MFEDIDADDASGSPTVSGPEIADLERDGRGRVCIGRVGCEGLRSALRRVCCARREGFRGGYRAREVCRKVGDLRLGNGPGEAGRVDVGKPEPSPENEAAEIAPLALTVTPVSAGAPFAA
jgi:hypothetical protein